MKDRFHPYQRSDKGTRDQKSSKPAWKNIGAYNQKERVRPHIFQIVFSTTGPESGQTVNLNVISHAHFVLRQPQKKGISPVIVKQKDQKLKCVNNVSCVDQLCSVKLTQNVPLVQNLTVGARLNQFWETWETLRARPFVIQMLKEGCTLSFQTRPNLTRKPIIVSCYVNPHRNLYLLEALHQLTNKKLVTNQESLGFYNRLFLVPKPKNKWRPILDLSNLPALPNQRTIQVSTFYILQFMRYVPDKILKTKVTTTSSLITYTL